MNKLTLQGTYTALVTPFKDDGSVDFNTLKRLINYQIDNGANGIVVCGSTGESATLLTKEKTSIIIKAVEYAAGRIPVIAGTGTNETEYTLHLSTIAKEHGADAILLVTPYYNKPTQEGLFEHFRLIAQQVDIPIILYNIPSRTGVNMTAETQLRIAENCKNVIATKEGSGDLIQMMQIIKNAPKHFSLLAGDDIFALPAISIGAKGVVSTISNYAPKQFSACVKAALDGNYKEAMKLHYSLFELMKLNGIETNPIPTKFALSLMGLIKEKYRLPLIQMQLQNKKKMKAALSKAGLMKKIKTDK
jgi:4-hydroxy-tetrahydrodipicolinate synthase